MDLPDVERKFHRVRDHDARRFQRPDDDLHWQMRIYHLLATRAPKAAISAMAEMDAGREYVTSHILAAWQ